MEIFGEKAWTHRRPDPNFRSPARPKLSGSGRHQAATHRLHFPFQQVKSPSWFLSSRFRLKRRPLRSQHRSSFGTDLRQSSWAAVPVRWLHPRATLHRRLLHGALICQAGTPRIFSMQAASCHLSSANRQDLTDTQLQSLLEFQISVRNSSL